MKRREFIAGLGGVVSWPLAAQAQQPAMPVIGFIRVGSPENSVIAVVPFLQGLKETGYVEGQNVAVEYHWADEQYDRLPALASGLVRRQVAVIAAGGDSGVAGSQGGNHDHSDHLFDYVGSN